MGIDELLQIAVADKRAARITNLQQRQQRERAAQEFAGVVLGYSGAQQAYRVRIRAGSRERVVLARSIQSKAPGAQVTVYQRGSYTMDYL